MKQIINFLFILLLIFGIAGCKKKEPKKISESDKIEIVQSKFAKHYPDFNPAEFGEILRLQIQNDSILDLFYATVEYTPVWVHDTLNTKGLKDLILILDNAHEHGLSPDLFYKSSIASITDSIDSGLFAGDKNILYQRIADLEQLSTKAVLKYIKGMTYGFLKPADLFGKDYTIPLLEADSTFYATLYTNIKNDPITSLINSHPSDSVYTKMQEECKNLENKKEISFNKIEYKGDNLSYKVGDKSKNISAIAGRLIATGEYVPDSIGGDSLHQELNEYLLSAINTFRRNNSYPEDKEVSKITIDALNRPIAYYQDKIRANMERYRWKKAKEKNDKHIEVNVAAFNLVASQQDSIPLLMRVCVGLPKNKTPLLLSDISYINLNPFWNVPTSITRKEIVLLQKKDPNYISSHNMRLFAGSKEVDVSSIDWKKVDPSKFGYTIRQEPGNNNSLGRLKFMFFNSFSVYLHDTPSKKAFSYKNRAVSHGCVRVQKPVELAFFCTSPSSGLYKDQLLHTIDKIPLTKEGRKLLSEEKLKKIPDIINMKDNISLAIDYYTVYMPPHDSTLYYADDVYGYDEVILKALSSI